MIFKYELRFVAFRRPNFFPCGRNLVYGICKLKPENLKTYFLVKKKLGFYQLWPRAVMLGTDRHSDTFMQLREAHSLHRTANEWKMFLFS